MKKTTEKNVKYLKMQDFSHDEIVYDTNSWKGKKIYEITDRECNP